jgi:hypothetical protein
MPPRDPDEDEDEDDEEDDTADKPPVVLLRPRVF